MIKICLKGKKIKKNKGRVTCQWFAVSAESVLYRPLITLLIGREVPHNIGILNR